MYSMLHKFWFPWVYIFLHVTFIYSCPFRLQNSNFTVSKSMVLWCKFSGTSDHKKIRSPSLVQLVGTLLDLLQTSHRWDFKPDMKALLNFMDMGFTEEDICDPLCVMGNNHSAAVSVVSCLYSSSNLYKFCLCY